MISVLPLAAAAALAVAAQRIARTADAAHARRLACVAVVAVTSALIAVSFALHLFAMDGTVAALGTRFASMPHGWAAAVPAGHLLIALVVVAMAPLQTHPPRVLAGVLRIVAVTIAFVAVEHPALLALVWGLSAWTCRRELSHGVSTAKHLGAFTVWHGASVTLAVCGSIALLRQHEAFGVGCWLAAIVIRETLLPCQGWLPALFERAPLGLVVAFTAPQIGVHAFSTLVDGQLGGDVATALSWLAAATAVVGAAVGLVQQHALRAAGWLVVSQTGLVFFGMVNSSPVARTGALLHWHVMSLALSGFAMTLAALGARRSTLSLRRPGGSFARTPRMASAFLLLGFASVGLPLTTGFVAEDLLVQGAAEAFPHLSLSLLVATAMNGIAVMRCFFTLFSGTAEHLGERDLVPREARALTLVMAVLVVGGVVPKLLLAAPMAAATPRPPRAVVEDASTRLPPEVRGRPLFERGSR